MSLFYCNVLNNLFFLYLDFPLGLSFLMNFVVNYLTTKLSFSFSLFIHVR